MPTSRVATRYVFQLFALNTTVKLSSDGTAGGLLKTIKTKYKKNIIGQGSLTRAMIES
jgi:hypothetical protein